MKKLLILFLSMLIATCTLSQDKLDNEFYFRFGYSLPSWKQFGGEKDEWQEYGYKRNGVTGEIGTIFMLNSILKQPNMAIGIDADYLSFFWHRFHNNSSTSDEIGTLRFTSKIGPSFTYSPIKYLAFDVYVKADISWVTATVFVSDNNADNALSYANLLSLGFSTGFNVRYRVLMVGFEFNTVSPKLENVDNEGYYLGNLFDSERRDDKTSLPSFSFTFGLSF